LTIRVENASGLLGELALGRRNRGLGAPDAAGAVRALERAAPTLAA